MLTSPTLAPDRCHPLLGRVFGIVGTATQLGAGLAYTAGALLVDLLGARPTFTIAAAGTLAVLLLLVPTLRRHRDDLGHPAR